MDDTLTTLRAALSALERSKISVSIALHKEFIAPQCEAAITDLRTLIASMEAQPADDFHARGLLAKSLKCWRRLTAEESDELVAFVAEVQPSEPKSEPAHDDLTIAYMCGFHDGRKAKTEPVQEPVAWMRPSEEGYDSMFRDHATVLTCTGNPWTGWVPLYAAPQARKRLSDEQISSATRKARDELFDHIYENGTNSEGAAYYIRKLARTIEKAHDIEGGAA